MPFRPVEAQQCAGIISSFHEHAIEPLAYGCTFDTDIFSINFEPALSALCATENLLRSRIQLVFLHTPKWRGLRLSHLQYILYFVSSFYSICKVIDLGVEVIGRI